ncbi:hypothetical protein VTN49DRAFT_6877 [Thermomyces lanuginosus]|uniref:uncharacterized protein n=1 Tax=Thermomyces lanuginosus TaxID=5541 RepID=UPI003743F532
MDEEVVESPRKRLKTDVSATIDDVVSITPDTLVANEADGQFQRLREAQVGITEFVSTDVPGFEGVLKKRYSDFLVNEILPSGEVLHLRSLQVPESMGLTRIDTEATAKQANGQQQQAAGDGQQPAESTKDSKADNSEFQISEEDRSLLDSYLTADVAQKIIDFHSRVRASPNKRPGEFGRVSAGTIDDRELRTKIHHAIRRVFNSLLESRTEQDGTLVVMAAPNRHKRKAQGFRGVDGNVRHERPSWEELGGQYLHFTMYKENKDTMEVLFYLARQLKMNAKSFQFAGTKDRRGVTVQRASVFKVYADRLAELNKTLRNAALGDFEYRTHQLTLGDLNGNEFVITLRDCSFPEQRPEGLSTLDWAKEIVGKALHNLRERGYLNYYGLQRFGTFSMGTHAIGIKMLQGNFKGAVEGILHFLPEVLAAAQDSSESEGSKSLISADEKARAEAIHIFQTTQNANAALAKLPKKFSAEASIIRYLNRIPTDYLGALQAIPRNLRLMYLHAYQSLVWNHAASERWRRWGPKVVEGDLVIVEQSKGDTEQVDADGEIIVNPQAGDRSSSADEMFVRARPLSAEEAASGKYSIFDVVLPLPGFDVVYPANEMTDFYKEFMGSEQGGGLDPFDMRRKWKDLSLSGSYRKLLSRPGEDYSYEVRTYIDEDQTFVQTDLDRLNGKTIEEVSKPDNDGRSSPDGKERIAVIMKFQLGSSQYATMALRELMKMDGLKEYKPGFSRGR